MKMYGVSVQLSYLVYWEHSTIVSCSYIASTIDRVLLKFSGIIFINKDIHIQTGFVYIRARLHNYVIQELYVHNECGFDVYC